jgi:hypothetical protein
LCCTRDGQARFTTTTYTSEGQESICSDQALDFGDFALATNKAAQGHWQSISGIFHSAVSFFPLIYLYIQNDAGTLFSAYQGEIDV